MPTAIHTKHFAQQTVLDSLDSLALNGTGNACVKVTPVIPCAGAKGCWVFVRGATAAGTAPAVGAQLRIAVVARSGDGANPINGGDNALPTPGTSAGATANGSLEPTGDISPFIAPINLPNAPSTAFSKARYFAPVPPEFQLAFTNGAAVALGDGTEPAVAIRLEYDELQN